MRGQRRFLNICNFPPNNDRTNFENRHTNSYKLPIKLWSS